MVKARTELQVTSLERARELFFEALEKSHFFDSKEEEILTLESFGRVTSREVLAKRSVPHFRSAAMDGIAVRAEATQGVTQETPVQLKLDRDFIFVDTGDLIPEEFDAVVMIEKVRVLNEAMVEIDREVQVGKHIRAIGEDFSINEQLLEAGQKINSEAIAAMLSVGVNSVWMKRQLRCVFIPTGSELREPESELKLGELPETNSIFFQHYITHWGAYPIVHPIVQDTLSELRSVFSKAINEYDLIAIGSGTSKGRDDWTACLVKEFGKILVHGVAYHPGHPVLLGIVEGKPVIGVPGYPVAAWVCLMQFIKPLLEKYYGLEPSKPKTAQGVLTQEIRSMLGYREFVRVRLEANSEKLLVHPLLGGASRLASLLHADGWIEVLEEIDFVPKGTLVSVNLME